MFYDIVQHAMVLPYTILCHMVTEGIEIKARSPTVNRKARRLEGLSPCM